MNLVDLVRRYQSFDPDSGQFDRHRTAEQYAALLGVSASVLSRFYTGQRPTGATVLRAFLRRFPQAAREVAAAIAAEAVA